jgi:hypothetical protein
VACASWEIDDDTVPCRKYDLRSESVDRSSFRSGARALASPGSSSSGELPETDHPLCGRGAIHARTHLPEQSMIYQAITRYRLIAARRKSSDMRCAIINERR